MIGIIVLVMIIILFLLGMVGWLSVAGAAMLAVGSFGALIYDRRKDRWKRAGFVALAILGVLLMVRDVM